MMDDEKMGDEDDAAAPVAPTTEPTEDGEEM